MKQQTYSKNIILILAASFFYFASPMLVTPLITGFSGSIGASAGVMGVIGGLMNLCSLFCRPFVGNLADRISKYRLSFIGAVLMTVACLGYMTASDPYVVIFARMINGVGFACCSVCMSTWMCDMLPKEKIGSGMGLYGKMNALGMAIAPAIGVSIYQMMGYRVSFALALMFSAFTILIIQFISDKGEPRGSVRVKNEKNPKIQVLDRKVIPIAIIIMLFAIPYCATQSFLVSYIEARNLSITVSLFFPLYAIVLFTMRFSMKSLFDRLPFRIFLFGSSISAMLGMLCLAWMKNNFIMFFGALFMAGGYGIMSSVCQSTAILLAGEGKRGLANSTYYVGLDLGMTLGPVIGGVLYGNIDLAFFYPFLLITVPIGAVVYFFGIKSAH